MNTTYTPPTVTPTRDLTYACRRLETLTTRAFHRAVETPTLANLRAWDHLRAAYFELEDALFGFTSRS